MKSSDGKSQREEKSRRGKIREEKESEEKVKRERIREEKESEEGRSEKRKSQKQEDAGARKGRKVAKHCAFPMICGSGGSKSRLAKAAGAAIWPDER